MDNSNEKHACCHEPESKNQKPWFLKSVWILTLILFSLVGASYFFDRLVPLRGAVLNYAGIMFFPVLLGLVLGGIMDAFVPREYIAKHLTRPGMRTIFYAVGLGFLMSACNHGILALSMALHRKGASGPAVISFLLASPWANLPVTFLLIGFFGWAGVLIILLALLVALTTGLVFQGLLSRGLIETNRHSVEVASDFSIRKDLMQRLKNFRGSQVNFYEGVKKTMLSIGALADMVMFWIMLGVLLAALSAVFVPEHWFEQFMGPDFLGLGVTLGAATVIEICSEGTSPLAFTIYQKTGALGNAFAFLMAGVVTDYTEIGLVWKNLGRRTALWMLAVTLPQVIVLAMILNAIS